MTPIDVDRARAWLSEYWPLLRVPAGALLGLILLLLLVRRIRTSGVSAVAASIATPLVLAWEAQGMFTLARWMGVPPAAALVLSGVTAAVLVTLASRAHDHYQRHGVLGPNARLVWAVAVPMGLVVALAAHSLAEGALRIVLPLLAATVWWSRYLPDEPASHRANQQRGSWRWTPRRLGVTFGLLDPTDADLNQVHAERQIRKLTATAHKMHHGAKAMRRIRSARLRRLGLLATPEMIGEVQRRITLVHTIEALTAPVLPPAHYTADDTDAAAVTSPAPSNDDSTAVAGDDRGKRPVPPRQGRPTAARVAKAASKYPDATPAEIAARLKVSERTVQRYLPKPDTAGQTHLAAA